MSDCEGHWEMSGSGRDRMGDLVNEESGSGRLQLMRASRGRAPQAGVIMNHVSLSLYNVRWNKTGCSRCRSFGSYAYVSCSMPR